MTQFYDQLETRSNDERAAALARALPDQIARAQALPGYGGALKDVDAAAITTIADLAGLAQIRSGQGAGKCGALWRADDAAPAWVCPYFSIAGPDL